MLRKDHLQVFHQGSTGQPGRAAYTVCTPLNPVGGGGSGGNTGIGGTGSTTCKTICYPYQDSSIALGRPVNETRYSCSTICTSG